jgi:hypothetical protein
LLPPVDATAAMLAIMHDVCNDLQTDMRCDHHERVANSIFRMAASREMTEV